MTVSRSLGDMLSGMARQMLRGPGPEKWCKRCSRRHGTRERCRLHRIAVQTRSGLVVERLTHLPPEDRSP